MPRSPEELIQYAVHAIESGGLAVWMRRTLFAVALIVVVVIYMYNFRGLAAAQAIDQAQIGRALVSGHGWQTNFIRPRAVGQLRDHGKDVASRIWFDTYNAPLAPLVDAIALFPVRHQPMTPSEHVYVGDKAIVLMSIALFFGSIAILFFMTRRLFDQKLALLGCGLVLVCEMLWQYSLSGLPQMLLLFLFNATLYALVRAVEEKNGGGRVGPWLAAIGLGFGLLALAHALTIWIFLAALIFSAPYFRPRYSAAVVMLIAFLIVYTPWLLRNYIVCGNPAGTAIYSVLDGIRYSEAGWLRRIAFDPEGIGPATFRDKIANNFFSQTGHIFDYLGWSVVAASFFIALLHPFKRNETNVVRWFSLTMWAGAVLGMAIFGLNEEEGFAANQLHLLFVPIMTCYGLAYLLVQWNRLGIGLHLVRIAFITGLFLLCGLPMINSLYNMLLGPPKPPFRWPPYIPPAIATLNTWMQPNEIIASDMPWAVAWYADRRSLWLPDTVKALIEFNDSDVLKGRVNGLLLTPVSGSQNKLGDIVKGEYHEWAPLIQRTAVIESLPFKWATVLGDPDCLFIADYDRTKPKGSP